MIHNQETIFLLSAVRAAECASIMGLSNMGKSALLRELCAPAVHSAYLGDRSADWLFVYIDCNLMPERSEQALHEVILRNAIESLRRVGAQAHVGAINFHLDVFHQRSGCLAGADLGEFLVDEFERLHHFLFHRVKGVL